MNAPRTVVVGAGIIGALVAHELLARSPGADITVLDRDTVGSGASLRSAGLHFLRGGTDRVRAMSQYSSDFYAKLMENQQSLPIYPLPETSVITSRANLDTTREAYLPGALMTSLDRLPNAGIQLPEDASLWRIEGCHQADVHGVSEAIALELRSRVKFREGVQVTALESSDNEVRLQLGTDEELVADNVIIAPGPWLHAPAWSELVAPLGIRVKKIVALHVEQVPSEQDRAIVFQDEDAFVIPVINRGHWIFSYTCQEWDVEPDELHDGLSADNLEQARECLRRYSPALAEDCTSGRMFCDAYSANGEPQVQTLDRAGRVIFAGAANGSGYRLAPAIAAEVADLLGLAAEEEQAAEHEQAAERGSAA